MTTTIALKKPHRAQRAILRAVRDHRFTTVVCGRRFGKTEIGQQIATTAALDGKHIWWEALTYKRSTEAWEAFKALLHPAIVDKSEVDRRLKLSTGGVLQVWSAVNPDTQRGSGLDLVVLDEAAYMTPELWRAVLRPALSDRRGKAVFLSSPNGRNWFWTNWMRGHNPAYPQWASLQFPSSANPLMHPDEIEDARSTSPERLFRQEYLAEFLDDGGVVFRFVRDRATAPMNAIPDPDASYVMGVDWARDNDFTCCIVMERSTKTMVAMEHFNTIGWALQRGRLAALADKWKPDAIWAEANSIGGPNIEALQAEGLPVIPFTTTAQSKGPLIDSLALAFEQDDIAIQPELVLLDELQAYSLERLASGRYRYSAPAGMHDDTVIALALADHGARNTGFDVSFV